MTDPREVLRRHLPDLPRWVEARDLVLGGPLEVVALAFDPALGPTGLRAVLRDADEGTVFVVGRPEAAAVREAVGRGADGDLMCEDAHAAWVAALLPGWTAAPAILHQLDDLDGLPASPDVAFVDPSALERVPLPDELRDELRDAASHTRIAASFVDGAPVAFCYAGSVTETWWDVAVDTVPAHRRAGHASRCAAFLIRDRAAVGLRPVWAAHLSNPPSWRLAAHLGFREIDRIGLLERP